MKKIPTVLVRDASDRAHVTDDVTPGCEWVLAGEGVATRKYDGTCVMLDDSGQWWARREVKKGKTPPENYMPEDFDEVTGKTQGWEPIEQSPFASFHAEALVGDYGSAFRSGTYELFGPKINGNPERAPEHLLINHIHGTDVVSERRHRTVHTVKDSVRDLARYGWEGVVWHHSDGRMAKLKARDLA